MLIWRSYPLRSRQYFSAGVWHILRIVELRKLSGEIVIVQRPTLFSKIGDRWLRMHDTIAYYGEFIVKRAIVLAGEGGYGLYPLKEADDRLFESLEIYYQKVLDLLTNSEVKARELEQKSRHEFFICGELKTIDNKEYLSQSKLSWLLGNEEKKEGIEQTGGEETIEGTGDAMLDVIGRVLVFLQKGQAIDLCSVLSPEEIMQTCSYAGRIISTAMKTEEETIEIKEEDYSMSKEQVEQLRETGLRLPNFSD